jgi:hypothetical protein
VLERICGVSQHRHGRSLAEREEPGEPIRQVTDQGFSKEAARLISIAYDGRNNIEGRGRSQCTPPCGWGDAMSIFRAWRDGASVGETPRGSDQQLRTKHPPKGSGHAARGSLWQCPLGHPSVEGMRDGFGDSVTMAVMPQQRAGDLTNHSFCVMF